MHVDVTGDDNARRVAKEQKRDVNTVLGAAKCALYTVGPLFGTLNAAMLKKNS